MRLAMVLALALAVPAIAQDQMQDGPILGFDMHPLSGQDALDAGVPNGVMVDRVPAGSPAEAAGLKRDDVIFEVNGAPVRGRTDVSEKIGKGGIGGDVKVTVMRGKEKVSLSWKTMALSAFIKMIGVKAPMLRVDGWVGGDAVTLSGLKGRVVALVFWTNMLSADVKPNVADTEAMFTAWHQAYKDKGLAVVPIHTIFVEFASHPTSDVVKYLEDKKFPMAVAHATGEPFQMPGAPGQQQSLPLVLTDYRTRAFPSVVLVDKDGKIQGRWEGPEVGDGADVKKKIEEMLGAK